MQLRRIILWLVCACICGVAAFGREEIAVDYGDKILLPAPSSSAFKQYSSPQPLLSTGTINIPLDLYDFKYHELEIPFTLHYNTQGIRVFADSYPYGLGWTMTPGLRVTRVIMGLPDEIFPRHQYSGNTDADSYDILSRASTPYDRHHATKTNADGDSLLDMQHDIFTVYLPRVSHTFVLDTTEDGFEVVSDECNNLKITTDRNLSRFEVIDGNGVTYAFSKQIKEFRGQHDNVTAWMLEEVVLPNGNEVSFSWGEYTHHLPDEFGCGVLIDVLENSAPNDLDLSLESGYYDPSQIASVPSSGLVDAVRHLTEIDFPTGHISFEYHTRSSQNEPATCGGEPLLSRLVVTNSQGEMVREVTMHYDKMNDTQTLLESIDIAGEGTYSFDYNKVSIPYSQRYAQDWWGYYNGKIDNPTRIPQISILNKPSSWSQGSMRSVGEADRSVDTLLMDANMLTTLHFPTGGFCRFEYELHRWNMTQLRHKFVVDADDDIFNDIMVGGGLRVKRISLYEKESSQPVVTEYKYGNNETGLANCIDMPLPHTFISRRYIYTITYSSEQDIDEEDYWNESMLIPYLTYYRETLIFPESNYMRYHFNESPIWYDIVTSIEVAVKRCIHSGGRPMWLMLLLGDWTVVRLATSRQSPAKASY